MCTFILKSYSQKTEIEKPHFFILSKGNNSGKPLKTPCPNCFAIQFNNADDKEQMYWLLYCLWKSNAFYPYLRGSVIPFVTISDTKKIINHGLIISINNRDKFNKMLLAYQALDEYEAQLNEKLSTVNKAKKMLVYNLMHAGG